VDYVSTAVRADTERASALDNDAERRLRAALERAEARARDLEALLDVAQDEAERSLVTAASTVAGVREGVAALRADLVAAALDGGPTDRRPRGGPRAAEDEPADADVEIAEEAVLDELALVDVRAAARPRVRRRPD
jgi:hypothetical protein